MLLVGVKKTERVVALCIVLIKSVCTLYNVYCLFRDDCYSGSILYSIDSKVSLSCVCYTVFVQLKCPRFAERKVTALQCRI